MTRLCSIELSECSLQFLDGVLRVESSLGFLDGSLQVGIGLVGKHLCGSDNLVVEIQLGLQDCLGGSEVFIAHFALIEGKCSIKTTLEARLEGVVAEGVHLVLEVAEFGIELQGILHSRQFIGISKCPEFRACVEWDAVVVLVEHHILIASIVDFLLHTAPYIGEEATRRLRADEVLTAAVQVEGNAFHSRVSMLGTGNHTVESVNLGRLQVVVGGIAQFGIEVVVGGLVETDVVGFFLCVSSAILLIGVSVRGDDGEVPRAVLFLMGREGMAGKLRVSIGQQVIGAVPAGAREVVVGIHVAHEHVFPTVNGRLSHFGEIDSHRCACYHECSEHEQLSEVDFFHKRLVLKIIIK